MDINLTLFGQFITFCIFIWFTMKYVWPPITKALNDRQKKIADGLAAAEQGVKQLAEAQANIEQKLQESKLQAANIVEEANKRSGHIIDEARDKARVEGERLVNLARAEIAQEVETARQLLRAELAALAIAAAEKIVMAKIDYKSNERLLEKLISEI